MLAQVFERDRVEQELRHEAYHDAVTGLPNRALFRERLTHALSLARRTELGIAVAVIDLDRFKEVNDTLGHEQGDRLLAEVGRPAQPGAQRGRHDLAHGRRRVRSGALPRALGRRRPGRRGPDRAGAA